MGETSNTALMAEFASAEIFKYLGWERVGSTNIDWECVSEAHGRTTHPADAVYQYLEPYQNKMTYVLCDFKSYHVRQVMKQHHRAFARAALVQHGRNVNAVAAACSPA